MRELCRWLQAAALDATWHGAVAGGRAGHCSVCIVCLRSMLSTRTVGRRMLGERAVVALWWDVGRSLARIDVRVGSGSLQLKVRSDARLQ